MKKPAFHLLPLFFFSILLLSAQNLLSQNPAAIGENHKTDTLLHPQRLGEKDLVPFTARRDTMKIISGSRFPVSAADLPFSTYIITKEEIRQNAYETLVDALKMVPGFRVSQPGSAVEGETFLMRGLLGNTYAKILINDVPIKPAFVAGMPIGAQLPVREAERIEIIYGAGAALYGGDASAGVINIITKQSEKPVFMQADLSVGQGLYSSVNVLFGAKLGRDKHIFRISAYGSNVLLERRNVFYDEAYNYNPVSYLPGSKDDTAYFFLPNYAGTAQEPLLTNTPHLSRKFGMTLSYKNLTLSVESMYRRDHSSIGLNPLAVTYRNPLTYTGEGIWRVNLHFFKKKAEKRNRKTDITYLRYKIDERSSVQYVFNQLAGQVFQATLAEAIQKDSAKFHIALFLRDYERLFDGLRYSYGSSDELSLERVHTYRLLKILSLTAGFNGRAATGEPRTDLLARPASEKGDFIGILHSFDFDTATYRIKPEKVNLYDFNSFGQVFFNSKRVNLAAGVNYNINLIVPEYASSNYTHKKLSPRVAALVNITDNINARCSWGRAFRVASEYYKYVSYDVHSGNPDKLSRPFRAIEPENSSSLEGGVRYKEEGLINGDLTYFSNEITGLINYENPGVFSEDSTLYSAFIGYGNSKGSKTLARGWQITLGREFGTRKAGIGLQWSFSRTKLSLDKGDNKNAYFLPTYKLRVHQIRLSLYPIPKTTLLFDFVHLNRAGQPNDERFGRKDKGYSTLDLVARYAFTDRFDAYIKITNLTNKQYAGLPATRTPDDLHYNPQTGFFLRLGMNYFLE